MDEYRTNVACSQVRLIQVLERTGREIEREIERERQREREREYV